MKKHLLALSIGAALGASPLVALAADSDKSTQQILQELEQLKQRVEALQTDLDKERARNDEIAEKQQETEEKVSKAQQVAESVKSDINVGGAVRFNYAAKDWDEGSKDRYGDLAFDTFRLNLDGKINDVILSAEWRWYEYMSVIHHAWVGYEFTDDLTARAGIFQVPFGVLPYNSHNFYFSSLYYAGLEDNYDFGLGVTYEPGDWRFDVALLKNDERGGASNESYSANVTGYGASLAADDPVGDGMEMTNTIALRGEYDFKASDDLTLKPGASLKFGQLDGLGAAQEGTYYAAAAHLVADYKNFNAQLQYTDWEYDIDDRNAQLIEYGYYAFNTFGPLDASAVTANLAYTHSVDWGPISSLTFYNDYSHIFDKNADLPDTWMNVTGMAVAAGPVYAYFDYIVGKNQPFVNGSLAGDGSQNSLFNINVGYYF